MVYHQHRNTEYREHQDHIASGDRRQTLHICLLGGFRVSRGSQRVADSAWRLGKARSLVQLLTLMPGHHLHREQVMDLFWPDLAPKAAAGNFYQVVHAARRALATLSSPMVDLANVIQLRRQVVALDSHVPFWIDVNAFQEAATIARASTDPAAYQVALSLYTGELLPEHLYDDWLVPYRDSLHETYWRLLIELAQLHEHRAEHDKALEVFRQAVTVEPAGEQAHAGLMRAAAVLGQRQQALGQYEVLRQVLRDEFDAEPDAVTQQLYEEILTGRFPQHAPSAIEEPLDIRRASARHNIPAALTSFVGREQEVTEIERLLATHRLVTLVGPGGSGKTRLALIVASKLLAAHPDGAWLVELAPLVDPAMVPKTVAMSLGVREESEQPIAATLREALRHRDMLLILDNCEHLVDGCADLVASLLRACPGLRILATSREALHVPGEVIVDLPLLRVPDLQQLSPLEPLARIESVQLFIERASLAQSGFSLTEQNAEVVAEVCVRLEGLPLAIELAAARLGTLTVEHLAEWLDDALRLLKTWSRTIDPRHQTLQATLDWSYALLSEPEQTVFRRLSVFAGGWTFEAAEAVAGGEDIGSENVLDLLTQVAEKSLIQVESSDGLRRYRMLETIRQYAFERLVERGEADQVRQLHAEYYLRLAEAAMPGLRGTEQSAVVHRLEREHDNLRYALSWLIESRQIDDGLHLAWLLSRFWPIHGSLTEGRSWLDRLLTLRGSETSTDALVRALFASGRIAFLQSDYSAAYERFQECLTLAEEIGDREFIAGSLTQLAHIAWRRGDYPQARSLYEEGLIIWRDLGDRWYIGIALTSLGQLALDQGDYALSHTLFHECLDIYTDLGDTAEIARSFFRLGQVAFQQEDYAAARLWEEESLARWREVGDRVGIAIALDGLAHIAIAEGEERRARESFAESLKMYRIAGSRRGIADCLEGFAVLAMSRRRPDRALRLAGAAATLRRAIGEPLDVNRKARLTQVLESVNHTLPTEVREVTWHQGRAMTLDQAIEYALSGQVD